MAVEAPLHLHAGMKPNTPRPQNPSRAIPGPIIQAAQADIVGRDEDIARKAYFSYIEQGSQPGHDLRDWLEAEAGVRAEQTAQAGNGGILHAPFVV